MENKLKQICNWLNDLCDLSKPLHQNKLSPLELKALLEIVDVKRKGYLDLNDVYELAGNVSESELFAIFKFMDTQRTGEIGLLELEAAFGDRSSSSKNTTKEYIFPRFYAIIDAVKDKPRLASQSKKKYGFTPANLKLTYQYICNLVQSKYLTCQELLTVLKAQAIKYGMSWGVQQENLVKQLLPDQNVSESKFVQCLSCESKVKAQIQEECLLSDFQPQNLASIKSKTSQVKVSPITLNKESLEKESNPSIIYKKTNNFVESTPNDSPSFRAKPRQNYQFDQKEVDCTYTKQFDAIEGNVNEVLNSIQQRRQKLRQDSLERKKLIEDVMNRKRQFCGSASIPSSPQSTTWKGVEETFKRSGQDRQKNSKSYLNKTHYKGASSYKQPGVYEGSLLKNSYQTSEFNVPQTQPFTQESSYITRKSSVNGLKITVQRQLSSSIRKDSRPFTPQQPKYEINDILKKYNNFGNITLKAKFQEQENNTLKQLCKSKSGFIYSQYSDSYQKPLRDPVQIHQANEFKYQAQSSNLRSNMSKENILKRAEEEANRKIEQIQRKARMKVLEKKGMSRGNKEEWGKLLKRGCYY